MDFSLPTYIVVDMPTKVGTYVRHLRERYSPQLVSLPAEITLVGSSGVGVLAADTVRADVVAVVERVAAHTSPLEVSFASMVTFSGTGVFYFPPIDPTAWLRLHREFVTSGLRFLPMQFPFTPHLTAVRLASPPPARVSAEVLAIDAPPPGKADALSVYALDGYECQLIYRTVLRGSH